LSLGAPGRSPDPENGSGACTYPHSLKAIERDFVGIPDADVREIVGGRAARLFSVD
jgi:hypothetical protein